jgi:hypothetical protein
MSAPDPALLGALVVAGLGAAVDIYLAGGARLAGAYEKERQKFYEDNWQKCKDLDELAGLDFTRALITSDLWKVIRARPPTDASASDDGESTLRAVEAEVQARTGKIRQDLEVLLKQFRSRTGNRERLEQTLALFNRCADRTRKGWGSFAVLIVVESLLFAGWVSQSSDVTSTIYGVLVITGVLAGGLLYVSGLDWMVADRELRKCREATETEIHQKIHFGHPPVKGLQAPPSTAPAPAAAVATPAAAAQGPASDTAGKT